MADLAAFQTSHGWRVAVASPTGGDLSRWISSTGARHLPWRARRSPGVGTATEVARLGHLVRGFDPDLVHLHSAKAGLAGRLVLRGRYPTIYQPHAWSFLAAAGLMRRGALKWERFAARWTHALVCVSEEERAQGVAAGIDAPWHVVTNGIDLERIRPSDLTEARAALGLGAEPLVVCVGRLSRQKGQDVLVAGWPSVLAALPDARLALVGDGPAEEELRRRAPGGVSFVGPSSRVGEWLAAADVVALPSRWEGMSLTMLEAMAAGRSIVMTDVPGAREALGSDAGAVVPVEDGRALSRALVERLTDPATREAEGRAARRRVERKFDLDKSLNALLDVYDEVLRGAGFGGLPDQP